jgi:phage terminase large subunit GpA-like protein
MLRPGHLTRSTVLGDRRRHGEGRALWPLADLRDAAGYIHFPVSEVINQNYFDQLTSEQVVTRKKEGRPYRVWVLPPKKRNEALDTFVLALAARSALPIRLDLPPPAKRAVPDTVPLPEIAGAAMMAESKPLPPAPPSRIAGAPMNVRRVRRVFRSSYMER